MEPNEIVRALRNDLKLNRREFCDYFNIPYRTVQDWECGKRTMPEYVLRLLEYKIRTDERLMEKSMKQQSQKGENSSIHKMRISDYEEVHKLWLSCDGVGLNELDDSRDGIERFLLRNPDTCFVAERDGKVAGVILAGNDGRRAYIYHLAVLKEYRGNGIAAQLVDAVVNALKLLGIKKAALVVFKDNAEGNAFWEKMGFTVREDLLYRNRVIPEED